MLTRQSFLYWQGISILATTWKDFYRLKTEFDLWLAAFSPEAACPESLEGAWVRLEINKPSRIYFKVSPNSVISNKCSFQVRSRGPIKGTPWEHMEECSTHEFWLTDKFSHILRQWNNSARTYTVYFLVCLLDELAPPGSFFTSSQDLQLFLPNLFVDDQHVSNLTCMRLG